MIIHQSDVSGCSDSIDHWSITILDFGNISTNIIGSSKNVNLCTIIFMLERFSHKVDTELERNAENIANETVCWNWNITQAFYQCLKIIFGLNFNQISRMFDISVSSENP